MNQLLYETFNLLNEQDKLDDTNARVKSEEDSIPFKPTYDCNGDYVISFKVGDKIKFDKLHFSGFHNPQEVKDVIIRKVKARNNVDTNQIIRIETSDDFVYRQLHHPETFKTEGELRRADDLIDHSGHSEYDDYDIRPNYGTAAYGTHDVKTSTMGGINTTPKVGSPKQSTMNGINTHTPSDTSKSYIAPGREQDLPGSSARDDRNNWGGNNRHI